jgi:hypothetical protein
MRTFLFAVLLGSQLVTSAYAQVFRDKEVSGALYLPDGTVIVSPMTYHEKAQLIVRKDSSAIQVFTTFHVDSFFFYDPELMWQRRFHKRKYQGREQFF